MKKIFFIPIFIVFLNCQDKDFGINAKSNIANNEKLANENSKLINKNGNTIKTRFNAPEGYTWIEEPKDSFGGFIENFPLLKYGSPILKYDGTKISTQNLHEGIFDIDVGNKDLQQCADAVIRMRAEYLFETKKFGDIKFHFTSGDLLKWNDYANGIRAFVNGNKVSFRKTAAEDHSKENFRKYLDLIFTYAGTISMNKETIVITKNEDLKTGDILNTPGSPGHVVFVSGVAKNKDGKKLYLLSQGFTPAQSIHIISNPFNPSISPWYELDVNSESTTTARYDFKPNNFRRYQ